VIGPGKDWHYLAVVFAVDAEPQMRVYCDGAYVLSYGQKEAPVALTEPNRWSIGGRSALVRPFETVQPAAFDVGSLRFWSEARTAQQVASDASTFEPGDQPSSASVATEFFVADTEPPRYWSRAPYQTVSLNGGLHQSDPGRTGSLWDVGRKIAPIVFFHPAERHFPASVEWFLQRTDLVRGSGTLTYGDGGIGLSRLPKGMSLITRGPLRVQELLHATSSTAPGTSNENVSLWPSAPDPVSGFPFSPTQHTTLYGEPLVNKLSPAKCYCRVTQDQKYSFDDFQYYYFTYYFFYPYNGGIGPSALISDDAGPMDGLSSGWVAHIGDWERVVARVAFNPRRNLWITGSYAMEWHGNDEWKFFYQGLVERLPFAELHPFLVYSSWHSHASHTSIGNWPTDTSIADDRTGEGARWHTGDHHLFLNSARRTLAQRSRCAMRSGQCDACAPNTCTRSVVKPAANGSRRNFTDVFARIRSCVRSSPARVFGAPRRSLPPSSSSFWAATRTKPNSDGG
jgi:hypothetical protein